VRKLTSVVIFSSVILFATGGFHFPNQINEERFIPNKGNGAITTERGIFTPNGDTWTTGGPYGGFINSLAMSGSNPDIIYAGTSRGVFATLDGGSTWMKRGLPDTSIRVVQAAPDNPDFVYAGTKDGIYKSEDGGINWTQRNGLPEKLSGAWVNAITIDPQNHEILYAGTGRALQQPPEEITGIFKSTDGGGTWQLKLSDGLDAVAALLIDTDNASRIYAGVRPWGSASDGFCKSIDWGETWACKDIDPPYTADEVDVLAMSSAGFDPPVIYAVGGDYVYKSTDRGEVWTRTNFDDHSIWALAVDPSDPDVVYAGTGRWRVISPVDEIYFHSELHETSDGGNTWSIKDNGLAEGGITSIVIDPRNSDVFVGLSAGGVYKSTDGAENWNISSQGMNDTWIYDLAVHPTLSDTVFAAIWGGGHHLAATTSGGASWDYFLGSDSPTHLGAVAIDPQEPATLFVGNGYGFDKSVYVHKSIDGGQNWTPAKLFSKEDYFYSRVSEIWVMPSDSSTILVAVAGDGTDAGGVYRSTDGGATWQRTYTLYACTLAADPTSPEVLYFGSKQCGDVFRSTDGGSSWTNISPSAPPGECWVWEVRDIEVDQNSHVFAATDEGLMVWDGLGWTKQIGLPTDDITAITIDNSTSPGTLYIGTGEDGVYISQDGGSTWSPYNEGLGNLSVTRLTSSASQPTMLYAGTAYGGVWRITIPSTSFTIFLPLVNNGLP
jgi:photosystem II stability/assembly factor-like uncharacterized protein